jgi:hypothetical protein
MTAKSALLALAFFCFSGHVAAQEALALACVEYEREWNAIQERHQRYGVEVSEWDDGLEVRGIPSDFDTLVAILNAIPDECGSLRSAVSDHLVALFMLQTTRYFSDLATGDPQEQGEQAAIEQARRIQAQQEISRASMLRQAQIEAEAARLERERVAASQSLPAFPWPPPTPTEQTTLNASVVAALRSRNATLFDLGEHFKEALDRSGYSEIGFYDAPGGFAIISRLERIEEDGRPAPGDFRYMPPGDEPFSLQQYLTSLFVAPVGRYRVIVFVVTNQAFAATGRTIGAMEARSLLRRAANRLPDYFRYFPLSREHQITALVYEFERSANDERLRLLPESRLSARTHLERSGLYAALAGRSQR